MSNEISFDENQFKYKSRVILGTPEIPGMTKFLIRKGLVRDEKTANKILFGASVTFLVISIIVFSIFIFDIRIFGVAPEDSDASVRRGAAKQKVQQIKNNNIPNPTNANTTK